ncbi:MAG TPA: type II toxin-antitoxin system VapC family toxin [Acidimicrobiales bacterium]|nr:type II toxin-antitoxin system VapC family toxin [Acidimicrobiales bacterium]
MIIDSSALIAILRDEPAADRLRTALASRERKRISTGTLLEVSIVVDANGDPVLSGRLDDLLATARIEPVPVSANHVRIAREAYRNFGIGSGHPAGLNFGDCFAYALARAEREPLLFVGDDFTHTDLSAA